MQQPPEVEPDRFPSFTTRGRIQLDLLASGPAGESGGSEQLRRLYIGLAGELTRRLRLTADVDLAGGRAAPQDIYLAYQVDPGTEIVAGFFKPANVQDELTSDIHTLFLERSAYSGLFGPGRRNGIGVNLLRHGVGVRFGLFTGRGSGFLDVKRSDGWLASARIHKGFATYGGTLHVAASAYLDELPNQGLRLAQKPEVNLAPTAVDSGLLQADTAFFTGAEMGFGRNALTLQAEGGRLAASVPGADTEGWGFSAQASFRLTGESRPYDRLSGTYGRVDPARPVTDGGAGAFETGARFTHVDLVERALGGRLTTYGLVLNWYPVQHLRLSGNLIHGEKRDGLGPPEDGQWLTFRAAFDW